MVGLYEFLAIACVGWVVIAATAAIDWCQRPRQQAPLQEADLLAGPVREVIEAPLRQDRAA